MFWFWCFGVGQAEAGLFVGVHELVCHTGDRFVSITSPKDFEMPKTLKTMRNIQLAKVAWPKAFRWLSWETWLSAV